MKILLCFAFVVLLNFRGVFFFFFDFYCRFGEFLGVFSRLSVSALALLLDLQLEKMKTPSKEDT